MKKLYSQFLTAFFTGNNRRTKALKIILALTLSSISYSGFAQLVVVTPATDTSICGSSAIGGSAPACTTLGTITLTETSNSDLAIGTDVITLTPPVGWQFCAGTGTVSHTPAVGDISANSIVTIAGSCTITVTVTATATHDVITITGLQVQATSTTAAAGTIYASSSTGFAGIVTGPAGVSFGELALIPAAITGTSGSALPTQLCTGTCDSLADLTAGGVWTSSNTAKATVGSASGVVCALATGSAVITYTVRGCSATASFPINAGPAPILNVHNMCAWYDSIVYVTDATVGGLYSSTGVTTFNVGAGNGKVFANAPSLPGVDTIYYTLGNGCRTFAILTVNPLPQPFIGPDSVCSGSSVVLSDAIGPGNWTSADTFVAKVDSFGGDSVRITGFVTGTTIISYKLTGTGCITDTPFVVDTTPVPIVGPTQVCFNSTIIDSDLTSGGTWSSGTPSVATIDPFSGRITTVDTGVAVILYTLRDGCETISSVTVDPLPDSITGPSAVCIGDSVQLLDGTAGGTWTASNGNAIIDPVTGYYTGITAGADTITYSIVPGNCVQTYIINVNPLPGTISGPDSVCQYGFYLYTDGTGGGAWSVNPSSVATINSSTGILTGTGAGTAVITYTLASTTGCQVFDTIVVDSTPVNITGPTQVCAGDTITLSDATPGGVWSVHDTTVAKIDSVGDLAGISAGPETVSYSIGSCPALYFVTVDAVPTAIIGPDTVCLGAVVTYTDAIFPGTWSATPTSVGTIDPVSGTLTTISVGTVILKYVTTAGGCFTTGAVTIDDRAPILGDTVICQGGILHLTNAVPNPSAIWAELPVAINPLLDSFFGVPVAYVDIQATFPGIYTVEYILPTGCTSTLTYTVNPISPITATTFQECVGDSTTLHDATPGGAWSEIPVNTFGILNTSTGGIKGVAAGVEAVTYTMPSGCNATIDFTVNPLPVPITGPTTVCIGDSIQLIEAAANPGFWRATNGHATIDTFGFVTGVSTGVDTFTFAFDTTLCTATYVVTVNPLAPIIGIDSMCLHDSVRLSDADSGGVWSFVTGIGTFSGQVVDSAGDSIYFKGILPGFDSIIYTLPVTGCRYAFAVTVNGLPDAISGRDTLCVGDTVHLFDDSLGGTWTEHNSFTSIGLTTGIDSGLSPGVDTITYTLITGCSIRSTVTVDPNPLPISGPPYTVCLGHDTTLTDVSTGGIWSVSDTLTPLVTLSSGNIFGHALGSDTVFYTLTVGGCRTFIVVTVTPIPVVTTSQNHHVKCEFDSVRIWADSGMSLNRSYSWTPAYGLNNTTVQDPLASPTVTTVYTVVATDNTTGCDSFAVDTVYVDDSLTHLRIVGLDSICDGTCDSLVATGWSESLFRWHTATGLSISPSDTVRVCPDVTTLYWAVAKDALGCMDSVSFTVTVNPIPIIVQSPNPAFLCKRTPLQIDMSTTNTNNATDIWSWTPDIFISCDSCFDPIFTDTANIVYKTICTTQYGCYDSFNVRVSVLDTNVNTIVPDTNLCIGGAATLIATSHSLYSNLDIPTFIWMPDYNLSSPDSNYTIATPQVTTTYSVAIHENACFNDTLSVTVFVQPYPVVDLTPTSPLTTVAGTPIQIAAVVPNTPIAHYIWKPAIGLSCDTCYNPVAVPSVNTTYVVTITSIYGCTVTDSITILIGCDKSQVFIPNTFTPNGDGVNDRFYVSAKGVSIINYLNVYNRWGQLVFSAENIPPNDAAAGWDGTFKGLVLEPDVFVYTIEATCELGGPPLKYKGDVSIVK